MPLSSIKAQDSKTPARQPMLKAFVGLLQLRRILSSERRQRPGLRSAMQQPSAARPVARQAPRYTQGNSPLGAETIAPQPRPTRHRERQLSHSLGRILGPQHLSFRSTPGPDARDQISEAEFATASTRYISGSSPCLGASQAPPQFL